MRLVVKVKHVISFDTGKKEIIIQKVGSDYMYFHLSEVRGFSDGDIKYIISTVPEYENMVSSIKAYVNELEGSKTDVLAQLMNKYPKLREVQPMNCKVKLETKIKHWIDYEGNVNTDVAPYSCVFMSYDKSDGNILYNI